MKPIVVPTNSLILLLDPYLFSLDWLVQLFRDHFENNYGSSHGLGHESGHELLSWTPLIKLGRIFLIYKTIESAKLAKLEMDGFIWEFDQDHDQTRIPQEPLRVFYGPHFSLPLPSLSQTLLSVPALSRNFLISPPGSPPVGWEQTLEEAPNSKTFSSGSSDIGVGGEGEEGEGWGEELARALRYLSVTSSDSLEDEDVEIVVGQEVEGTSLNQMTTTIIPPTTLSHLRPSITLSTPPSASSTSSSSLEIQTSTQPSGINNGNKINQVKATIESMLGRKKSLIFSPEGLVDSSSSHGVTGLGGLAGGGGNRVIIPTARPPTEDERVYLES